MSDEVKKFLNDILFRIELIDGHLNNERNYLYYKKNLTVQSAIERELQVIGEATSRIIKINPDVHISYMKLIISMRNRIVHAYDSVDKNVIWKVVNEDIPVLKSEVEKLLND